MRGDAYETGIKWFITTACRRSMSRSPAANYPPMTTAFTWAQNVPNRYVTVPAL